MIGINDVAAKGAFVMFVIHRYAHRSPWAWLDLDLNLDRERFL